MSEYGIVQTGFVKKRYVDILADMQARAKANYGDNVVVDTNKPLGKFLDVHAWAIAELWEELEETYNSIAVDTAEGIALDRIVKYKGLRRKKETTAGGVITITGTPGTFVNKNFLVGKEDTTTYFTIDEGTVGDNGILELNIVCSFSGSRGNAEIGAINQIVTPITGIASVTNLRLFVNGQDYETDRVLRERYVSTVGGLSTVESIRAATSKVAGVISNLVLENPLLEVDEFGLPPKSFEVYIYGGDEYEIAEAILNAKAAGIQAYGTTVIPVTDINGYDHDIGFTRASVVNIQIQVNIKTNQYFAAGGVDAVKLAILQYVGGVGPDGTQYGGLKINTDVIHSYLSSLVWPVGGISDVDVKIAKEGGTLAEDNIEIDRFEIARTSFDLIEVVRTT